MPVRVNFEFFSYSAVMLWVVSMNWIIQSPDENEMNSNEQNEHTNYQILAQQAAHDDF